ncbi:MAG: TfoX/Sxy family protein [Chitinophagales bacterium]
MAYDEKLADRIRIYLGSDKRIEEKKMFGGLAFLLFGKMTVGVIKNSLMLRVLPEMEARIKTRPHVEEMKFTGKAMKEFASVHPEGLLSDTALHEYIELGIAHAESKIKEKPWRA